jgi:hypothetical protein
LYVAQLLAGELFGPYDMSSPGGRGWKSSDPTTVLVMPPFQNTRIEFTVKEAEYPETIER